MFKISQIYISKPCYISFSTEVDHLGRPLFDELYLMKKITTIFIIHLCSPARSCFLLTFLKSQLVTFSQTEFKLFLVNSVQLKSYMNVVDEALGVYFPPRAMLVEKRTSCFFFFFPLPPLLPLGPFLVASGSAIQTEHRSY